VQVAEDATTYAFMDINPGSDGHLLVIPKRHSKDLFEIGADDLTDVTLAAQRIAKVAVKELGADGVNLINCCGAVAWQTVFHFHLHVVPRYVDKTKDRLTLPWQPGVPGSRETLTALGGRLAAALG
jgi:histidine triad (HIT) family protein